MLLSSDELVELNRAAQRAEQGLLAWARTTLLWAAARPAQRVHEVVRLHGEGLTQTQVARRVGVKQPYVTKLLKISTLAQEILNHWDDPARRAVKPVSTDDMWRIADLDPIEQRAEYYRKVERAQLAQQHHHEKLRLPRGPQNRRR